MVLKPDTGQCSSEEVVPRRGVDTEQCSSEEVVPRRGVDTGQCASEDAECHGHACPGPVAHGCMPMTSQTLVMSFHSSVFPFVILERMTPQENHV